LIQILRVKTTRPVNPAFAVAKPGGVNPPLSALQCAELPPILDKNLR
jgi:hypothetical protein